MVRDLKESGGGGEEDGEDRISDLPDQIIHIILNRLKSPDAASRTSVLSRRWFQLWRGYPSFGFPPSKSNESRFRSFVESCFRKLPPTKPSDSDHISGGCRAGVTAIQDFSISLREGDFGKEYLDRLLLFITSNVSVLSPVHFELCIRDIEWNRRYSLPVSNWSGMKSVSLSGCFLTDVVTADGASLVSLESLCLDNVTLSNELLHSLLGNAPRLVSLSLHRVFGIDKLELVSCPLLQRLLLSEIYTCGKKDRFWEMRRLRVLSPNLLSLSLCSGLKKLDIDAPNLVSLSWTVYSGDPSTRVNVINLASDCRCTVHVQSYVGIEPQWLRLFLSTNFIRFHHLNLVSNFMFRPSKQQESEDLTDDEYAFLPPMIDQVQCEPLWWDVSDIEKAATFLNRLFWVCRPKFMSIAKGDVSLIAECMCREYLKIDRPNDVTNDVNSPTSWSHDLKDMKIENDTTGEMMEISEDMIPSLAKREKVKFMLIWF
ncbi:unnamed protein product [Linum tenue]|uniref:F-box domain-containing protein n=1 Tax=Linum tenue TaxID=586396 RepID=A0AAV0PDJ3_9ROSI|nr:unnamed protein product [Linum tenue]